MGRVIVLLLLIMVLAAGGIVWFDYLNVIDVKTTLAPVYRLIGREGRSAAAISPDETILNLDAERLTIRLEALELQRREMDSRDQEIQVRFGEIEQMAQELEERQKALDERENSFNASRRETEDKERNVEQNARYLTGMNPAQAVGILTAMDDQDVIDVFRKTEEIAQAAGAASLVSVWLSQLPPARAAELQRKMASRPQTLN
ncbi:flagellar protein FlbB [Spirochaetia bacterium]|nr:flagellar protein FlbB [Spirochaetia bacterium]